VLPELVPPLGDCVLPPTTAPFEPGLRGAVEPPAEEPPAAPVPPAVVSAPGAEVALVAPGTGVAPVALVVPVGPFAAGSSSLTPGAVGVAVDEAAEACEGATPAPPAGGGVGLVAGELTGGPTGLAAAGAALVAADAGEDGAEDAVPGPIVAW